VALDVADVRETEDGLVIHLRRSKTDQEGQGIVVALLWGSYPETCPVRAYRDWIRAAAITIGAIFAASTTATRSSPHAWIRTRWPPSSNAPPVAPD
jgi:hypothetical protein